MASNAARNPNNAGLLDLPGELGVLTPAALGCRHRSSGRLVVQAHPLLLLVGWVPGGQEPRNHSGRLALGQAARPGRRRPSSPPVTWAGRCCSPMRALRTRIAPVRAGITHWSTLSWRWALATSSGVWPPGSVPPSTGTSPAWFSLAPRARDQAVAARAAPVRAALATVAWATPCWPATRPLLAASRTVPPTTWAAMPARLTGVQRSQPEFATRSRCLGSSTSAAAPFSPTAPISEPPNQVARPRSCKDRETVLSAAIPLLLRTWRSGAGSAGWPAAPAPVGVVRPIAGPYGGPRPGRRRPRSAPCGPPRRPDARR